MNFRVPALPLSVLAFLSVVFTEGLPAQDDPLVEIAALRKAVDEQGRQITALSAQVAELVARLDGKASGSTSVPMAEPGSVAPANPGAPLVAVPLATELEPNVHVVGKGDSLEKIAKSCGMTTAELQKLNNITNPNKLQIGQKILLPAGLPPKAEQ